MKLTEETIRKEFGDYKPPSWLVRIVQKIAKEYAEKIINECVKNVEVGYARAQGSNDIKPLVFKNLILDLKEKL